MTDSEASEMLMRMQRLAQERAKNGENYDDALRDIAATAKTASTLAGQINLRATLLGIRARRQIRAFVHQFPNLGEGVRAFLEGSSKLIPGARMSVSIQEKAIHGQFLGRLIGELEREDLLRTFKSNELSREIHAEIGELEKQGGKPGISGSLEAQKIAKIIEGITDEMVSRQNSAGAYIEKLPGYIVRQTHDMSEIRRAGGIGSGKENLQRSFQIWAEFVLPLVDPIATFKGQDPVKFLRDLHASLYTGTHGPTLSEASQFVYTLKYDLSKQVSKEAILHFKDADSAWKYNERFGTRSLKDQIFSDIYYRARSIALMENFGPRVDESFERLMRELREDARVDEDAGKQTDSLKDWRIQALYDAATGKIDIPGSYSLAKSANVIRGVAILARMGSTVISALADKVFMNAEFAYNGIHALDRWSAQLTGMATSAEKQQMLRLMGVAMDGIIGSTVSRYTTHQSVAGKVHRLQQLLFDVNFLNWWTDSNKGAAAELFSAHLGEHEHHEWGALPEELGRVLRLYGFTEHSWDAVRRTAWTRPDSDARFITPDQLTNVPDESLTALLRERDLRDTPANRTRVRTELDTMLRTYFVDRVDFAVPTPGLETKKWTTLGTRVGTPLGEIVRMIGMFKSFPITIAAKILSRDVYGQGANSLSQWILNDHRGKFNVAQLIAMTTIAGYISGVARDAIKGRTPKRLIDEDGHIDQRVIFDAASRGSGLGILGDFLFNEYDRQYRSLTSSLAGPVLGQLDPLAEVTTLMKRGEWDHAAARAGRMAIDNTPFVNLFYVRPILDYFIFWNMQEMLNPGSLKRTEDAVKRNNNQGYWFKPSDMVR